MLQVSELLTLTLTLTLNLTRYEGHCFSHDPSSFEHTAGASNASAADAADAADADNAADAADGGAFVMGADAP